MRLLTTVPTLILALAVAACGTASPTPEPTESPTPEPTEDGGCPDGGWDAAVIWSSELAPESRIDFIRDGDVVAHQPLPHQGLEVWPDAAPFWSDDSAWLVANGPATRDTTHVLRWSPADCSVKEYKVDEQVIWGVVADDEAFYTTNSVNGEAHIRRRSMTGDITAEATVPSAVFSALALDGDRLVATGAIGEPGSEETVVVIFDAATLTEQSLIALGPVSYPVSILVRDGELHVPTAVREHPDGSAEEVSTVDVVNLDTGVARTVDLGVLSPYLVEDSDAGLVFAHTFMNPLMRDMDDYRDISLFDPQTLDTTTTDVGPGLMQIAVADNDLLVLTQQEGFDAPTLTRYSLPELTKGDSVDIEPPPGGTHYVAGILHP